jgi:hypothetical protein
LILSGAPELLVVVVVVVGIKVQLLANVIPFGQSDDEEVVVVVVVVEPQLLRAAFVMFPAFPSAVRPLDAWNATRAAAECAPNFPSTVRPALLQAFKAVWMFIAYIPDEPFLIVEDPKSHVAAKAEETANANANATAANATNFVFDIIKINFNYPFFRIDTA